MEKTYTLTKYALDEAENLGISQDDLQEMLRKSARVSHTLGNRRFHDYVFDVQGGEVFAVVRFSDGEITLYSCKSCKDSKRIPVFDECQHCYGTGCAQCDNGLVRSFVPCQDCSPRKTKFATKQTV